jgi:hypothetical protein
MPSLMGLRKNRLKPGKWLCAACSRKLRAVTLVPGAPRACEVCGNLANAPNYATEEQLRGKKDTPGT